jgi:hypothetical protein
MKIKNLQVARKYGFCPIFHEENLPSNVTEWNNDFTDEEIVAYSNLHLEDDKIKKQNIVVSDRDELYWFDDYLILNIGHSRRGQYYYIFCHKKTLELYVYASKPDGSGGVCNLPDILVQMILTGDVVLK